MYKLLASFAVDDNGHPGRYRGRQRRPARSQGRDGSVTDGQPSSQALKTPNAPSDKTGRGTKARPSHHSAIATRRYAADGVEREGMQRE